MNKIIHLSLARKSVPIFMDIVQGTTAPAIEFILDDYTPPSNARARIYIKKEGGEVYNNCTLSGNVVTYTPTAGSFDVAGQCVAQLEFVQSSTVIVSWRIFVTVEPNLIMGSAAPASTEFGALTQLIQDAQKYDVVMAANNITGANNRFGWIALTSGQDLNSITTPGVYYCNSTSTTEKILNVPEGTAFKMFVESSVSNTNYLRQRFITHTSREYIRTSTNTGASWGDWKRIPSEAEVNAIANRGGKNFLGNIYKNNNQTTKNGITYTLNSDGSITLNGTATAQADYYLGMRTNPHIILPKGTYILTGCPEGGSTSTYYIGYNRGSSGTTLGRDIGNGVTITDNEGGQNYGVWITVAPGFTVENLTFYPMIRDASIQDDTYVPYGMSNAELTTKALELKPLSVEGTYYGASAAGTKSYELESGQAYLVLVAKVNTTVANSNSAFIVVPHTTEGRASITPLANNTDYVEASISSTTLTLTLKANYMKVIIMKFTI